MWKLSAGLVGGACPALIVPGAVTATVLVVAACVSLITAAALRWPWLAAVGLGLLLAVWQMQARLADRLSADLENQPLRITGTVVSVPQGTPRALKFRFAPRRTHDVAPDSRLVELTWYDAPTRVLAAEDLEVEVKLRRPRGFSNPGGQDNEARMLREASVRAAMSAAAGNSAGAPPRGGNTRCSGAAAVAEVIRGSRRTTRRRHRRGPGGGFAGRGESRTMAGACTQRHEPPDGDLRPAHRDGGRGGRVARRACNGADSGAERSARRDVAAVAGALAAIVYGALAGWSMPTQRTLIMIVLARACVYARRRVGVADGLGLCAGSVVLLDPLSPLAPGFWLSFGAVAAILFGGDRLCATTRRGGAAICTCRPSSRSACCPC